MGKSRSGSNADVPAIWEWMAEQHLNSDPECAASALHVSERWGFGPYYNHARVLRTLHGEQSEHLHGLRKLTDQYAEIFDIERADQVRAYGSISPLIPLNREQCSHRYGGDVACTRDAVPGTGLCGNHGGSWITDAERMEIVRKISHRLVDLSERAVHTLGDLMDNAKSEKVRMDSAIAVLDRIGLSPVQTIEFSVTGEAEKEAAILLENLNKLGEKIQRKADAEILSAEESAALLDEEIVEGEIEPDAR